MCTGHIICRLRANDKALKVLLDQLQWQTGHFWTEMGISAKEYISRSSIDNLPYQPSFRKVSRSQATLVDLLFRLKSLSPTKGSTWSEVAFEKISLKPWYWSIVRLLSSGLRSSAALGENVPRL